MVEYIVGKWYKRRDGIKAKLIHKMDDGPYPMLFVVGNKTYNYAPDGQYRVGIKLEDDIVGEWEECVHDVTDAEYRAHHGMKLWHSVYPDSKIQDGYKAIDYRRPDIGELFAYIDGSVGTSNGTMASFAPILEKI